MSQKLFVQMLILKIIPWPIATILA